MRIFDNNSKTLIDSVMLLLTQEEANELANKIESLDSVVGDHIHVNDINQQREITVAVYTKDNLKYFSEDIQSAISLGD